MVMRILNLVCLIILLAHWNGCLQFLVPMLQSFPKESWVCLKNLQVSQKKSYKKIDIFELNYNKNSIIVITLIPLYSFLA